MRSIKSQTAFAAAYLLLNFLFWICSAISVDKHWKHPFSYQASAFQTAEAISKSDQSLHVLKKARIEVVHMLTISWNMYRRRWQFLRILYSSDHRRTYEQKHKRADPTTRNFTSALWTAIALTGTIGWPKRRNAYCSQIKCMGRLDQGSWPTSRERARSKWSNT